MKKRTLALMLAGIMALGTAGCSQSESTRSATAPAAQAEEVTGTVTIKLAHNMDFVTIPDAIVAAADRLNEKYEAEGKDLHIEIETDYQRIDWDEYMQNILFATKSGDGPDIFTFSGNIKDQVRSGLLLDISDIDTSKFVEGSFDAFTVDGKIYSMPFDIPTRALYYNKEVLKELGWSDEEVEAFPGKIAEGSFTWEDFIALCQEVQEKGLVEWGMLHRPGKGNDFLDVLRMYGSPYYNEEGKLVVNQDTVTGFFQFIYDAANTLKITPQDITQRVWTDIQKMVGEGDAFAYYGPVFSSTYVAAEANLTPEELAESIGFALFPKSEKNEAPFTVAAPQSVSINAHTEYPEICKALLEEVYAGDSVKELAVHGDTIFSLTSVTKANEMEEITTNPILEKIGYMADYVVTTPPIEGESVFRDELFKQIVLLELGQVNPEDAFKDFKVQVELNVDEDEVVFELNE